MKSKKRAGALILAALMLTGQLAMTSCSDNADAADPDAKNKSESNTSETEDGRESGKTTETETETETEDESLKDDLPTDMKDYDGYEYTVLSYDFPSGSIAWRVVDICSEGITGERVNDAVFERNSKLEDRFGVKVAQNLQSDTAKYAKQSAMASDDFDLI